MVVRSLAVVTIAAAALALTPFARRVQRSWAARVVIEGPSMRPTLEPGDWVLVDPAAFAGSPPAVGDLVVVPDPREPARTLVKRVGRVDIDTRLRLAGDAPEASTDSRVFGAVDARDVTGRAWFVYWPPRRVGPVR